jgi:iron complex outermembrane recepter protein
MMKKLLRLATLALLFTGAASAQTTGSITGVVTDGASGKPVAGAVVVATSPAAPGEQTAVTDAKGAFTIANLPAGKYTLQASIEGYKPETRSDLVLGENVTLRANLAVVPEAVQLEEVVVTGSRIRRKDLNTPAPVTVLSSEQVTSSGKVSIGDFLQTLPEQGGAINTQVNNGGDGTTEVSLRSLGSQRTLVLLNGRRMVAGGTSAGATVDLNSIPTAAIERIEILKDGASAVYGSDAIAGVVNIITKRKLNGTEASAYAGTTSQGDGTIYDLAVTTGTSSEKGSLMFSAGFTKTGTIWAGDRGWATRALGLDYAANEEFAGGSSAVPAGRFGLGGYAINPAANGGVCSLSCDPVTGVCVCDGADVASNTSLAYTLLTSRVKPGVTGAGLLDPTNYNSLNFITDPTNPNGYRPYTGADAYNFQSVNYLVTPQTRIQLFSTGDARMGDLARAYYEASFVNRQSRQQIAPDPLFTGNYGVTLSKDSMYNPTGVDLFDVRRRLLEFGGRANDQVVDTFRTVLGVDGTFPDAFGPLKGWFWDANFNWGRTAGTDTNSGALRLPLVQDALGPSMLVNGVPTCVRTPGDPNTAISGCVPLNVLFVGGGVPDAAQAAALGFSGTDRSFNQISQFAVNLTGELFKIGADRPIALALGADYTEYKGQLRINPINVVGEGDNFNSSDVGGGYDTTQGYLELQIPLLSNRPFVEDLELDAAMRLAHYSTFGNNTTYKAGVKYSPVRDVTLRGTYSTAYRAPSITDLYSGATESFPSVADPCANLANASAIIKARCQANGTGPAGSGDTATQLKEFVGGNVNVRPETANIFTIGLVLTPRMVENFSATVDYFQTEISNTIGAIGAANILSGCIARDYQPYCDAITRDPNTTLITGIDDLTTNYSKLNVAGVDVGLRYALPTKFGKFGFQLDTAFLLKYDQNLPSGQVIHGKGTYDLGATNGALPSVRAVGGLTYGLGDLGAGWSTRFIGSYKECMNNNPADDNVGTGTGGLCYTGTQDFIDIGYLPPVERTVSAYFLHDLFLRYSLKSMAGQTQIAVGVQNVFDGRPPRVYNSFLTYADTDYQFAGRSYYARVQQNF